MFLASVSRHRLAPFFQFLDVSCVSQPHQHREHIKELPVLIACVERVECIHPVAVGQSCNPLCRSLVNAPLLHERVAYIFVRETLHVDALRATLYGVEQLLRLLACHDEYRLMRRFLKQFQQFVGTGQVHSLRKPYHRHLISAEARLQRQFPCQFVAFRARDDSLLIGRVHIVHPLADVEIWPLHEHLPPLLSVVAAHRLVVGRHPRALSRGEREVQVGMLPLPEHRLGVGLVELRVYPHAALGEQIRRHSHSHSHLAAAVRAAQYHSVGNVFVVHHAGEFLLNIFLTYYFRPVHNSLLATSYTLSTADTV